ncbi:hypothetical protein DLAC_02229 [Tieghemostelium lacteum]|uniref:Uncharacterized protein n=1 Tax=Tieghemostelium lacteum TaxID=361077 RepID=A0A152A4F7_TIELA|nr:hypothetical protein DLAC_02229 [Tieghemostelium lacteum]|eukprot:KYR01126.1 hypothetical protein DLAC_02229 [Tieghemostelium lacteum]
MIKYLYTNKNLLKFHYTDGICVYCGKECENICHSCLDELSLWRNEFNKSNFSTFKEVVQEFFDWCNLSDDELNQKLECQQLLNDKSESKTNKILMGNFILPLICAIDSIKYDHQYNCFTQWIDSKSVRQRMVSYLFVYRSGSRVLFDTVFERILHDIEVYKIVGKLRISLNQYYTKEYLTRDKTDCISSATMDRVIHSLHQMDAQYIQNHIACEMIFDISKFNKISLDDIVTLFPKVTKKNCSSDYRSLDFQIQDIEADEINPSKPFSYYLELIEYCLYRNFNKVTEHFINHYSVEVLDYCNQYLKLHLNSKMESEKDTIFGILVLKNLDIKPSQEINQFIQKYLLETKKDFKERNQLFYKVHDINNDQFDAFLQYPQRKYFNQSYILYHILPKEKLTGEILKTYNMYLNDMTKFDMYILAFKFFTDTDELTAIFQKITDKSYSRFNVYNDYNALIGLIRNLDKIKYQSSSVDKVIIKLLLNIPIFDKKFMSNKLDTLKETCIYLMRTFKLFSKLDIGPVMGNLMEKLNYSTSIFNGSEYPQEAKEFLIGCYQFVLDHKGNCSKGSNFLMTIHHLGYDISEFTGKIDVSYTYDILANIPLMNIPSSSLLNLDVTMVEKLFKDFYIKDKPIPPHIYQICELKLAISTSCSPISLVETVERYRHDLENLYTDFSINARDDCLYFFNRTLDQFKIGCIRSKLFQQFYFRQIPIVKEQVTSDKVVYNLQILENQSRNVDVSPTKQCPTLPLLLITKIIHYIYYDPNIVSIEKIELSTVCQTWFNMCSDILTNNYFDDYISTYVLINNFQKINIESKFCLFKFYPKLMEYRDFVHVPFKYLDKLMYEHIEAMDLNLDSKHTSCWFTRDTNLKHLEIVFDHNCNTEQFIDIIKHSPNLTRIEITVCCSWNHMTNTIESIIKLNLKHLKYLNVYIESNMFNKVPGLSLSHLKDLYEPKQIPELNLISIPVFMDFRGFKSANIKFDSVLNDLNNMVEFYKIPLSTCTNKIQFTLPAIDDVLNLIDFVDKNHQTKNLTIRFYQIITFSTEFVQSIFDRLNQTQNIQSFTLFLNIYIISPSYSTLTPDQWKNINLHKFKYPNSNFITFYQSAS